VSNFVRHHVSKNRADILAGTGLPMDDSRKEDIATGFGLLIRLLISTTG